MTSKSFTTEGLNDLGSEDHLDLLNSIDYLRSQGINHYVSLPQIIVCGDQSSGKSAVLEAISGVSFPVKSNLCTRFPTELILRKTAHIGVKVSIVPHQDRSETERQSLGSFHEDLDGFEGLPALMENAKAAMGISTHGKAFSKDLLRVEVSGPDRPHLTIVDLPGLIHSQTKQQSAADVELVQEVVPSLHAGTKKYYSCRTRTIGVITKPDTLTAGSESEAMYISLARNQDIDFRLGWHVLKNMDSETGEWSLVDRDPKEEEFFSQGTWASFPRPQVGVKKIRPRLSKVLLGQIAAELPSLMGEIGAKADTCRDRLNKLGVPRATLDEQRSYLLRASQHFQSLVKASVDGTYNDPFFGDAKSKVGYQKRMRALTQNLNEAFAERITMRGHYREIVDAENPDPVPRSVVAITRDEFIKHIQNLMRRTRGRELPGTFNPMIVADLFLEQSAPWETITRSHIDSIWKATGEFLGLVAASIPDTATSKALFQKVFEPALSKLQESLGAKVTDMLMPHQNGHPITYNNQFVETVQAVRTERKQAKYTEVLEKFFGTGSLRLVSLPRNVDLNQLLKNLLQDTEPDMKRFACSEALDCMQAYYKVALERFIDDVVVQIVDVILIRGLEKIFSPVAVSTMPVNLVTEIAGESEESRTEREQLTKQLDILMKGSETCKRFIGERALESDNSASASGSELTLTDSEDASSDISDNGSEQSLAVRSVSSRSEANEPAMTLVEAPAEEAPAEEAAPSDWWHASASMKKYKKSRVGKARALFED